jgi:hypothetical protein
MDNPAAVLQQEVAESRRRAQEVVSGLVPEQLTRRPDSSKWSIAECIAHLNVTAGVVQPLIGKAIVARQERKPGGERTVQARKQRSAADLDCIATPPKFRMRAPKSVAPPVSIPEPGRLLEEFMRVQDDWERLWQDAEGLDLARINIGPRLSPFRCHVSASFPWMMAHQRRHLLQAENVKRQITSAAPLSVAGNG